MFAERVGLNLRIGRPIYVLAGYCIAALPSFLMSVNQQSRQMHSCIYRLCGSVVNNLFTCRGCTSVCLSVSLYRIFYRTETQCLDLQYLHICRVVSACALMLCIVDNKFRPSYNLLLRANIISFRRLCKKNYKITLDFIIFAPNSEPQSHLTPSGQVAFAVFK